METRISPSKPKVPYKARRQALGAHTVKCRVMVWVARRWSVNNEYWLQFHAAFTLPLLTKLTTQPTPTSPIPVSSSYVLLSEYSQRTSMESPKLGCTPTLLCILAPPSYILQRVPVAGKVICKVLWEWTESSAAMMEDDGPRPSKDAQTNALK